LYSLQVPEYLNLKGISEKNNYVNNIRLNLLNKCNALICKQECYDMNIDQIENDIKNIDKFLDPYYFYRILEEYFNVNIFVFTPNGYINPIEGVNDIKIESTVLEVPRSKVGHIRYLNLNRKSVIILKYPYNFELKYQQCELIISGGRVQIDINENKNINSLLGLTKIEPIKTELFYVSPRVFIFEEKMTNLLYDILKESLLTYTFSYNITNIIRKNPYSNILWDNYFKNKNIILTGQKLDSYGKLRMINIQKESFELTIEVPPSQPLNLPYIENIYTTTENNAKNMFGTPSGVLSNGLWFPVFDYDYGIFVPCSDIKTNITYEAPNTIINQKNINYDIKGPIYQDKYVKKWTNILLQIISWLWRVDAKEIDGYIYREKIEKWWLDNVVSSNIQPSYPKNNINRKLPKINNSTEGIKYMNSFWPEYFGRDGKMYFYPKLYEKLLNFYKNEQKYLNNLKNDIIPNYISNVYEIITDYPIYMDTKLFLNKKDYISWLQYISGKEISFIPIITKINMDMARESEPILIRNRDKFYLLQNVKEGNIYNVMNLCNNWNILGKNTGFYTNNNNNTLYPYIMYGISKENNMIPLYTHVKISCNENIYNKYQNVLIHYNPFKIGDKYEWIISHLYDNYINSLYQNINKNEFQIIQTHYDLKEKYYEILLYNNNFYAALLPL
jgi:hypothetical protein